jgi:hypothetical protein
MKLGIMQPYFFPYAGYFSLIKHTDGFILFDTAQFIRHGWIERNRILKPQEGWQYIQVPLRMHNRETKINNIFIDNEQKWKEKIIAQLQHYKKTAPFFSGTISLLNNVFIHEHSNIVNLNRAILEAVCLYLKIQTPIDTFSEMNLEIEPVQAPDEWALNICKAKGGVTEYWNPPGGQSFFNKSKYENAGINLRFQKLILLPYQQKGVGFESGLSIIDVMMFNSPEDISKMLDKFELT